MSILPTEKSVPKTSLSDYLVMIYGKPGIGKTTLAAQFENPLFCMFEPGSKSLSIYKKDIFSWKTFVKVIDSLLSEKHNYKHIVIDTYPQAFEYCQNHVCEENGWKHPQDGGYGKGFDAVYYEFSYQMNRLLSKFGVVLVAHAGEKDVEQLDGTTKTQIAPDMKGQAFRFISRTVDVVAYYYYSKKGNRFIRIAATDEIMAKNRIEGHFKGITKFPAGNSAQEAFKNFVDAFENKLTEKESTNGASIDSRKHQRVFFKRNKP